MEISISVQHVLPGHEGWIGSLAISHSLSMLISHSCLGGFHSKDGLDTDIILWDINTGNQLFKIHAGFSEIVAMVLSPTENVIATGNMNSGIQIWDLDKRESKFGLGGHRQGIDSLAFSPDGTFLAAGLMMGNEVKMYNLENRQLVRTFKKPFNGASSIAFSPDGSSLACGGIASIVILDVKSGEIVKIFPSMSMNRSISYSPNGLYLASGCIDKIIRIWDVNTYELIHSLAGHEKKGRMKIAYFQDDHPFLVSASIDKSVIFWNYETGEFLSRFQVHDEGVTCLALSGDGKILATGSNDGSIKIWHVSITD